MSDLVERVAKCIDDALDKDPSARSMPIARAAIAVVLKHLKTNFPRGQFALTEYYDHIARENGVSLE